MTRYTANHVSRYYANHHHHSFVMHDLSVGDDLEQAKVKAEELLGTGLRHGELVIYDSETIGFVVVASKSPSDKTWTDLV